MPAHNDKDLVRRHYATDDNLRIRHEIHEKYTVPKRDYVSWVLERLSWGGQERVLDLGCGPGTYYNRLIQLQPHVEYVGMDLLPTMLAKHPAKNRLSLGNAVRLPFADHTFDVVMANHMLHHVPNIGHTMREVSRVLRPGGIFVVATNSVQSMPELQVLMRRAIVLLTRHNAADIRPPSMPSDGFALENGTRVLSRYFFSVVRHDLPSALIFPEVEPAMAYLESTRDMRESQLPDDVIWEDVMMIMRQQINQLIKHLGELVINKQSGVLLATDTGGPIAQYLQFANNGHTS
ncbi:class I SAM-dependent methyltransferase [Phototrophicus methaneseepsis]|uniref:Class I SAM-dependent methyltransferase n=1 Tax=Phototrophicus methaneseepsis TaxID=2710758 RepID=A0A7S8IG82_9CHLR|nr:class I SAM-dependent methyltransferase [Phototrophicus methaneseepsis]QPC84299.1 class I SAM-dependent methyltransferase [Phototrophicus methaneseepsis]